MPRILGGSTPSAFTTGYVLAYDQDKLKEGEEFTGCLDAPDFLARGSVGTGKLWVCGDGSMACIISQIVGRPGLLS